MNRAVFFKKWQTDKAAAEAKTTAALAEYRAAQERYAKWRQPEMDLVAAKAALDGAQSILDNVTNDGELELRRDADAYLAPARRRLQEELQATRRLCDRGGGSSNATGVGNRLTALQAAVEQVDALAVSGEADLPAAVRGVMRVFSDFEVDPKFDVEVPAPAPQRNERFTVTL